MAGERPRGGVTPPEILVAIFETESTLEDFSKKKLESPQGRAEGRGGSRASMFSPWSLQAPPRGYESGGGAGEGELLLGEPWRLALYTALGNGLLGLAAFTVMNVWGLLTAFRAPLVWALLSSIALRTPKEALVAWGRSALERLSLAGCVASLIWAPFWPLVAFFRPLPDAVASSRGSSSPAPPASQIYFRWLWRLVVLFEAVRWCWTRWNSALQVASVGLTLGVSGGLLWAVLWASQAYLLQNGYHNISPPSQGARRQGVGRGVRRGHLGALDACVRRLIADYLDVSVAVGLIIALLSGLVLLVTVLAVQIANEGSRALSSGYSHASSVAMERGVVGAVKNGTAVAHGLAEENLPKAIAWMDEQLDGFLTSQNITHLKPHLDSFFEVVSLYMVTCPNVDRDMRVVSEQLLPGIPSGRGLETTLYVATGGADSSTSGSETESMGNTEDKSKREAMRRLAATKERCALLFGSGAKQSALSQPDVVTVRLQRAWGHILSLQFGKGVSEFGSLASQATAFLQDIALAMIPHLGTAAEQGSSELLTKTKDSFFSSTSVMLQWAANFAAAVFSGGLGLVGLGVGIVNFAVNFVIYLTCLFYLLVSEQDPLRALVGTLPLSTETRDKVAAAVGRSVQRVFICTLKMAAFHAGFTWLVLRATMAMGLDVHFPYCTVVAAAALAAVPIVPPYIVAVPVATQLSYIGQGPLALCFFATFYTVCSFADDAILSEIERVNPYLAFLSIFGGLYFFEGVQGAVLGPLLLAFLSCIHSLYMDAVSAKDTGAPPSPLTPCTNAPDAPTQARGVETRGQRRRRKTGGGGETGFCPSS